ncbi:stage II sporulation protein P, partial [Bacillus sp. MBGLi79]
SVLIEFFGVDHKREEVDLAAEAMADVFIDMYCNAEKVDADTGEDDKKKQ